MRSPYALCFISQMLVGFGACAITTLPGQISHQRFEPKKWALTTSLMLMANYSGWLFGSFLPQAVLVPGSVESLTKVYRSAHPHADKEGPGPQTPGDVE